MGNPACSLSRDSAFQLGSEGDFEVDSEVGFEPDFDGTGAPVFALLFHGKGGALDATRSTANRRLAVALRCDLCVSAVMLCCRLCRRFTARSLRVPASLRQQNPQIPQIIPRRPGNHSVIQTRKESMRITTPQKIHRIQTNR